MDEHCLVFVNYIYATCHGNDGGLVEDKLACGLQAGADKVTAKLPYTQSGEPRRASCTWSRDISRHTLSITHIVGSMQDISYWSSDPGGIGLSPTRLDASDLANRKDYPNLVVSGSSFRFINRSCWM